VRFLFVSRNPADLRAVEAPIRRLCDAGDEVQALVDPAKQPAGLFRRLEAEVEGLTIRSAVEPRDRSKLELDAVLRVWIDYLRYFEPDLAGATKYRERCGRPLPAGLREATDRAASASAELPRALAAGLRAVERSMPVPAAVVRLLERERPDAVVVSPLKGGSPQVPYLRAARRLGIPSALLVTAWDDLPTKSVIHETPDLVMVWNGVQRDEAVRLHGVPPDRIAVTGAPRFDKWFVQSPTTSHEQYCGRLGLPSDRPHILYVCSPRFTAPDEGEWISRWVSRLRRSEHPELRNVPVVVRPHPGVPLRNDSKGARRLARSPGIVVHPPSGARELDGAAFSGYFDSIHHAGAVVGINTTAMIEAAVVGRGVHVLLARRYRATQEESPHFDQLRSVGGGLIAATESRKEHAYGLARALRGEDAEDAAERSRSFLASFVRPHGLDRAATPITVGALQALAAGQAGR
jgi:hypothetical protein